MANFTTEPFDPGKYKLEGEMLKIFTYPSPILKKIANPVTEFNSDLHQLINNMLYTMYKTPGIGLAAPQVGISQRFFVMDIDFDREEIELPGGGIDYKYSNFNPRVIINPEFLLKDGEILFEEGCLSVPGIFEKVKRASQVKLKYQDHLGVTHELEADDILAVCLQHENDHLDGIVFLERLSQIKQNFLKKKFLKNKKKLVL